MNRIVFIIIVYVCALLLTGCEKKSAPESVIKDIQTYDEMTSLIEKSGASLIVFDLYADWCMPCRMLSPTLDSIALEKKNTVTFFRVNVDRVPQAAQAFRIQGIPFVVFVKDGKPVGALVGLRQKSDYVHAIDEYGASQK